MARFSLWVAALSLVCLIAVVTSQSDGEICARYFDDGSTVSIPNIIAMLSIEYRDLVPVVDGTLVRSILAESDWDHDDRLNLEECGHAIQFIRNMNQPAP